MSYDESFKFLDHLIETGCTFWDSADIYRDNEDLLGAWFKRTGRRNEIFLATKFGNAVDKDGKRIVKGDPEYVKQACESSLNRLGIETIDLYYAHRIDSKVPIEKTIGAMAELVKAGKVRYLGLSECSADTLRRACAVHPIAAVQMEYSPFALDIESEQTGLLKAARELGISIVAYSPLGRGMLTGRYKSLEDFDEDDVRRGFPRFQAGNFEKNLILVDQLQDIAEKKGATPGQLTLAWILAQGEDFIPIPGTKKTRYLDENLDALKLSLSDDEVQHIRDLASSASEAGARYPPTNMAIVFGDTPPL